MKKIGVIISGTDTNNIFLNALAKTLKKEIGLRIFKVNLGRRLDCILRRWQPRVLIVGVTKGQTEISYNRYFDLNPRLAIIGLEIDNDGATIYMHDLGREKLVQLIYTLSTEQSNHANDIRHNCVHLLTFNDFQTPAITSTQKNNAKKRTVMCYENTQQHLKDILFWIDLCLYECLALETKTDSGISTPGWTMSAKNAYLLLGNKYANHSKQELRKLREEQELTIDKREAANLENGASSKFLKIYSAFKLDRLDRKILILALAPELDGRYAQIFGFLNDDLTRRYPTATILAQLLLSDDAQGWNIREKFTNDGAFANYKLLLFEGAETLPGSEKSILPSPELIKFLLSQKNHKSNYAPYINVFEPSNVDSINRQSKNSLHEKLLSWHELAIQSQEDTPIIQLIGNEATRLWFVRNTIDAKYTVVVFDLAALEFHDTQGLIDNCFAAARVALLHDAILLITGRSTLPHDRFEWLDMLLIAELYPVVSKVAVHGASAWLIQCSRPVWLVEREKLSVARRTSIWKERARLQGLILSDTNAFSIASSVKFEEPEIDATLRLCGKKIEKLDLLQTSARRVIRSAVPSMVYRIEATFDWDDIILPDTVLTQMHKISGHVRYAGKVLDDWGYCKRMPYGQGVTVLFSGASGTGKTMAAQIIAGELGVDIFQVDLAKTISKYIGETEKNLKEVFEAAEKASAVLVFNEADALFGKRSEVRDAHDRYANVEVSYLLQQMETYTGLAILTTNLRQNLDSAFLRRLRFVVEFPLPEANDREAIWARVFPPNAPLAKDISFTFLARRLNLTGGHIQQIAIRAAFAAVAEDELITMRHIIQATREELEKLGMMNDERILADLAA